MIQDESTSVDNLKKYVRG